MTILYYDCKSGISGDMNLGALIDLGVDQDYVKNELNKLKINNEFELDIKKDKKMGITGTKVTVKLKDDLEDNNHEHSHDDHNHDHLGHTHDHNHNENHGKHRNFKMIKNMILESDLNDNVKKMSVDIFYEVAMAEGKVHGKPLEEVHFHEVGAIDSIVDIIGGAICIDYLNIDKVISSPLELGGGYVNCAHGKIPVPAPATLEILKDVPVKMGLVESETTTPTGAAILKAVANEFTKKKALTVKKIGYGIGNKDFNVPNVLRVYLGESKSENLKKKSK